jgi:hypothetical protein
MKKLLITALVFYFAVTLARGQGEINDQQKIFFRNERTFAAILSTDGFAASYREGKRIDFLNKRIYDFDIGILKHPKEIRLTNPAYQTPGTFIFGKINSVIFLRGGIGHQHEIFKKMDLGGVAVRYFVSAGPGLALYKPVYYKIMRTISSYELEIVEEKFDINKHDPTMIYGRSSFFKGFDEMKFLPGIFAKGGFNFEYSKEDKVIHAIEIGAQINAYPKKVPIMATRSNKAVFFSLFASYRFGVVIDPLDPESSDFSNVFRRKRL